MKRCFLLLATGLSLLTSVAQAQSVLHTTVGGSSPQEHQFTTTDLAALPRTELRVMGKDGKKHRYAGYPLAEVLRLAGAPQGQAVHGPVLAYGVFVTGADGYRALLALPEVDASFTKQVILLADTRDGQPLPAEQGPWQVVVPQDQRPARWVRQVKEISVGPVISGQ